MELRRPPRIELKLEPIERSLYPHLSEIITINYFGILLNVPNFGFLAIDQAEDLYWYRERPKMELTHGYFYLENEDNRASEICSEFIADVDLRDLDWKDSLIKIGEMNFIPELKFPLDDSCPPDFSDRLEPSNLEPPVPEYHFSGDSSPFWIATDNIKLAVGGCSSFTIDGKDTLYLKEYQKCINRIDDFLEYQYRELDNEQIKNRMTQFIDDLTVSLRKLK